MSIVFDKLRQLIEEYHISIILVHHSGKNMRKGGRGSSVIEGEYDSAITISKTKLKFDLRHAESPSDITISFNGETLWFESGGNNYNGDLEDDPVYEFLQNNGDIAQPELMNKWIEDGTFKKDTAYRKVNKSLAGQKVIRENKILKLRQ
jgi:hypothetical protein